MRLLTTVLKYIGKQTFFDNMIFQLVLVVVGGLILPIVVWILRYRIKRYRNIYSSLIDMENILANMNIEDDSIRRDKQASLESTASRLRDNLRTNSINSMRLDTELRTILTDSQSVVDSWFVESVAGDVSLESSSGYIHEDNFTKAVNEIQRDIYSVRQELIIVFFIGRGYDLLS